MNNPPLTTLPKAPASHRGSRERCLGLTDGTNREVAGRLTALVAPYAHVNPHRHHWMPRGHGAQGEAKLGESPLFLNADQRESVTGWWLKVRRGANTPNWDIVSQATIGDREGLILVEAKAHDRELGKAGKPHEASASANSDLNHDNIAVAINTADTALNAIMPGWNLSRDSHYQLANRFAWAWKIASLDVPVILVYLGCLDAQEMTDCGQPFVDGGDWQRVMLDHAHGIVPSAAWQQVLMVPSGPTATPLRALICCW